MNNANITTILLGAALGYFGSGFVKLSPIVPSPFCKELSIRYDFMKGQRRSQRDDRRIGASVLAAASCSDRERFAPGGRLSDLIPARRGEWF